MISYFFNIRTLHLVLFAVKGEDGQFVGNWFAWCALLRATMYVGRDKDCIECFDYYRKN